LTLERKAVVVAAVLHLHQAAGLNRRHAGGQHRFRCTRNTVKVVDPRSLPDQAILIPGLKPPVREFGPSDDNDPSEVDAFNQMIRELRNQSPAAHPDAK
jgi:hypothetical protein